MAKKFSALNRASIKALGSGERVTKDGITVQRMADGDLRWSVNVMVDGQRIHRVIGKESEGVTRQKVEEAIESFRTKAREGRLDLPTARKHHQSFAELAGAYIDRLEQIGGKNMKAKRQHVAQLLIPAFGSLRADRIAASQVQDYVRARLGRGLCQATINRELATLSHIFRRAAKWGWIKNDCIPELEKGIEPRKRIIVLSEQTVSSLMQAAAADPDDRLWLFVAFGLNTAMRHGEILQVGYDRIDSASKRIFIPTAKAGEREQPITPALTEMLDRQRRLDGPTAKWVFPSRDRRAKQPHRRSMAKAFQRAVIAAGLQPNEVTPHVMRHTAITRLVKAGVDLPTIQRISGHKTLAMVLRYVHIHGDHIDAAIARIDNAFADVFTPELHAANAPLKTPVATAA